MDIPFEQINADTLKSVVESFIHREGTEYGEISYSLEEKVAQVILALRQKKARLVFDPVEETVNIIPWDS